MCVRSARPPVFEVTARAGASGREVKPLSAIALLSLIWRKRDNKKRSFREPLSSLARDRYGTAERLRVCLPSPSSSLPFPPSPRGELSRHFKGILIRSLYLTPAMAVRRERRGCAFPRVSNSLSERNRLPLEVANALDAFVCVFAARTRQLVRMHTLKLVN